MAGKLLSMTSKIHIYIDGMITWMEPPIAPDVTTNFPIVFQRERSLPRQPLIHTSPPSFSRKWRIWKGMALLPLNCKVVVVAYFLEQRLLALEPPIEGDRPTLPHKVSLRCKRRHACSGREVRVWGSVPDRSNANAFFRHWSCSDRGA